MHKRDSHNMGELGKVMLSKESQSQITTCYMILLI